MSNIKETYELRQSDSDPGMVVAIDRNTMSEVIDAAHSGYKVRAIKVIREALRKRGLSDPGLITLKHIIDNEWDRLKVSDPIVIDERISLADTSAHPIRHDFHFKYGIDMRMLNSQVDDAEQLVSLLEGRVNADIRNKVEDGLQPLIDIAKVMKRQYLKD